jgi:ubiquinone/menaquinone biosynthesis C-methylase UbiE/uncharacterized protein YbaR (Trm112 family)
MIRFVCPRCHATVSRNAQRYSCTACGAGYPIVAGIPDFRVFPDPWIGLEDDRAKALRVEAATYDLDFESSMRAYWAITTDTPRPLAERYVQHGLRALDRSRQWIGSLDGAPPGPWLELGCGTGDFLVAALERNIAVVGIDIALRWLVIARRRPQLGGDGVTLVCCCAEALPFPAGSFARVTSLGVLEHSADPRQLCREARRVIMPGGGVAFRTVNRFSALPEPHVRVWGVGFMPRRWADRYVRWRTGIGYEHHRPLSRRELRGSLLAAGFHRVKVGAARVLDQERATLGRVAASLVPMYAAARRVPIVRAALAWCAPLLEVSAETR